MCIVFTTFSTIFFLKDEGISNPTKDMKLSDLFLSIVKELIFQKKGINLHLLKVQESEIHLYTNIKWIFCSFLKLNRRVIDK